VPRIVFEILLDDVKKRGIYGLNIICSIKLGTMYFKYCRAALSLVYLAFGVLRHSIRNIYLILLIIGDIRYEGVERINER
jgi:hypothetical protein